MREVTKAVKMCSETWERWSALGLEHSRAKTQGTPLGSGELLQFQEPVLFSSVMPGHTQEWGFRWECVNQGAGERVGKDRMDS